MSRPDARGRVFPFRYFKIGVQAQILSLLALISLVKRQKNEENANFRSNSAFFSCLYANDEERVNIGGELSP